MNFADGLTEANLGAPIFVTALRQHGAYCKALADCGLALITLNPDPAFPDSTFVEDTAVLTDRCAVIMQPGAPSRRGEIFRIIEALAKHYTKLDFVQPPGKIDGGDVCQIEDRFFIGISDRTNEDGARQLSLFLSASGFTTHFVDIMDVEGILHLKSGLSYLGDNRVLVCDAIADIADFDSLEIVRVPEGEEYAANCIRVNDHLLMPAGYPKLRGTLKDLGYQLIELDMSEFQKMDGGLSCLSLRF
jgi:dimethylargininase